MGNGGSEAEVGAWRVWLQARRKAAKGELGDRQVGIEGWGGSRLWERGSGSGWGSAKGDLGERGHRRDGQCE